MNQLRAVAVDLENIAVLEPCLATPAALAEPSARRRSPVRAGGSARPGVAGSEEQLAIVAIDIARPSVEVAGDRDALYRGLRA